MTSIFETNIKLKILQLIEYTVDDPLYRRLSQSLRSTDGQSNKMSYRETLPQKNTFFSFILSIVIQVDKNVLLFSVCNM